MEATVCDGRYQIVKTLGCGGFGTLYEAIDLQMERMCAIKEYTPPQNIQGTGTAYRDGIYRFREEATILKRLSWYSGVVKYYSYFEENGSAYITMELLQGDTIGHIVKKRKFTLQETNKIFLKAAEIADVCHEKGGILHRDLTPENIFLLNTGEVKLIDFGTAVFWRKSSAASPMEAKLEYAPPEQCHSNSVQGKFTDVYSLAASYYYVLSGKRIPSALDREKGAGYIPLYQICPETKGRISDAVDEALILWPEERTQTMKEFMAALKPGLKPVSKAVPIPAGKTLYLQHINQGAKGECTEFRSGQKIRIGRGEENEIILHDPGYSISRRHCEIRYDESGNQLKILDTSLNGTFINGRRLLKNEETAVPLPAKIRLANPNFEFLIGVKE